MSITTSIYLDKRRSNQQGNYPVKIRVTYNRISRLYKTDYNLSIDEFKKVFNPKTRNEKIKNTRIKIEQYKFKADEIIEKLNPFSFESFADIFLQRINENDIQIPTTVFQSFKMKVKDLKEEQRIGTANVYNSAMVSISKYNKGKDLLFSDITVKFLNRFTEWHKAEGNSSTTVGMYLRNLKALYNEAITNKIVSLESYPFGAEKKGLFEIPTSANNKKALSKPELKKIFDYKTVSVQEDQYRDLWIFSYYCNGLNIKDICLLKYSNINGNLIEFKREKTKRSRNIQPPIKAAYIEPLKAIVQKWGTPPQSNSFIFSFIESNDNETQIKQKVSLLVSKINKYMNRITKKLGIETKVTTYSARHSFASVLRNSGLNISYISQSLGHKNISTTQSYLDSIPEQDIQNNASFLNPNN